MTTKSIDAGNFPLAHFGARCVRNEAIYCQERAGCLGCTVICTKIDTCFKVKMVMDKELAGDWQYAKVIRDVCNLCNPENS
jgi:hypothetical protein